MERTLKQMVEQVAPYPFSDSEFAEAEAYADMKLKHQSELFGRTYDDGYRARVIAETINQNRMYARDEEDRAILAELVAKKKAAAEAAEDNWVKEMAHELGTTCAVVRMIVRSYLSTHIVAQSRTNCKMGV